MQPREINTRKVGRAELGVTVFADPGYGQKQPTSRPVVDAGADQIVSPGEIVTLGGSVALAGQVYRWRQVSGEPVTLSALDAAQPTFTAPAYNESGTNVVLFELSVSNAAGRTVTDRVQVRIRNPNVTNPQVKFTTSLGDFVLELDPNKAPVATENFLKYVDDGFYDATIFHRVIAGFVVQGGGFTADLTKKETRDPIKLEADNGLSNVRGTVAMARTNDPNSATSQFFVNVKNNIKDGDGKANLDPSDEGPGYTVFAKVTEGMDTVDKIAALETETRNPGTSAEMQNIPKQDVIVRSATRLNGTGATGASTAEGG